MNTIICWIFAIGKFLEEHDGAITAVSTIFIALFTIALWVSTKRLWKESKRTSKIAYGAGRQAKRSADIAERALIAGERAFIFAVGLNPYYFLDPINGKYNWRFRPIWQNSGDTPSKNMTIHTECVLRDSELPIGFDFDHATSAPGHALLPPKLSAPGGIAPQDPAPPITPPNILDIYAGKKWLYLYGWTKYWDVFPGTPQHITRFCWLITPMGEPMTYVPPKSASERETLTFSYIHHSEGNCADDECR